MEKNIRAEMSRTVEARLIKLSEPPIGIDAT